jgi:hypothetical protein
MSQTATTTPTGTTAIFTDAPTAYDYSYGLDLDELGGETPYRNVHSNRDLRRVVVPSDHATYQSDRYRSGLYLALSQEEVDEELGRRYSIIVRREEPLFSFAPYEAAARSIIDAMDALDESAASRDYREYRLTAALSILSTVRDVGIARLFTLGQRRAYFIHYRGSLRQVRTLEEARGVTASASPTEEAAIVFVESAGKIGDERFTHITLR